MSSTRQVMPKALIQQRLLTILAKRGRSSRQSFKISSSDVARFLHLDPELISQCARKNREIDEGLQLQLSNFFILWDNGVLEKVKVGTSFEIVRVPAKADIKPPQATIDMSGIFPRIKWSR